MQAPSLHRRRTPVREEQLAPLGRIGIGARGAIYCLVAWLAILVATGDFGETADRNGALAAVARQPLGTWLLYALAASFAAYAGWRMAELATGRTSKDDDAGWLKRAASAGKGLMYAAFSLSTLRYALNNSADADKGVRSSQGWTARVMDWPGGRALVVAIGIGVVAYGASNLWRAVTASFMDKLKDGEMGDLSEPVVRAIGTAGHAGRAVAFCLVGVFVVQAALDHDPQKSRGLDGALKELLGRGHGPTLVLVLAGGLLAFGLYCFAEARYRRVLGR